MKRAAVCSTIVLIVLAGVRPAQASVPVINVNTFGIELCPQFLCGAAIFTGVLHGQVGANNNAFGTFAVAVTHEDLPDQFQTAAITGGAFELRVGLRRIRGVVNEGILYNTGENTFVVRAVLEIRSGGSGVVFYEGLLNHNTFPPTIVGRISQ